MGTRSFTNLVKLSEFLLVKLSVAGSTNAGSNNVLIDALAMTALLYVDLKSIQTMYLQLIFH